MKTRGDAKKTTDRSTAAGPGMAELVLAVKGISDRLEILEKKTDLVLSQISSGSFERQRHSKQAFLPAASSQAFHQQASTQPSSEVKPAQGSAQGQLHGHSHERRKRVLHKAVCADCHKDCEIPFKPTGERPVYCKECFSRRKAGNSFKADNGNKQSFDSPKVVANSPERQVVVTKKGVGKVTVSDIVRPSVRDVPRSRKSHKPSPKPKR